MNHITSQSAYQYPQGINVTITGNRENVQSNDNVAVQNNNGNQLHTGDIIQGEVVETDGSQVKLMLNEGAILNARLEQEIQMLLGQKMIFAVRGEGSQISLSPLFENMAKQQTGSAALKEAGLAITENNLKLVSMLMQEGMSIDKGTLSQIVRQIGLYPDVPMQELLQMNRLGLPVNDANINQFQQYLQNNNQMMQSISDVVDQVQESFVQLMEQGKTADANRMLIDILETFEPEEDSMQLMSGINETKGEVTSGNISEMAGTVGDRYFEMPENLSNDTVTVDLTLQMKQEMHVGNSETVAAEDSIKTTVGGEQGQNAGLSEIAQNETKQDAQDNRVMSSEVTSADNNISSERLLTQPEMKDLLHHLKSLGIEEDTLKQIAGGKLKSNEILQSIRQQLQEYEPQNMKISRQLIQSSAFKKVLQNAVGRHWLLKPQDLLEDNGVTRFYEKLEKQTRQLMTHLEENQLAQTPFAKTVQNVHSNISFMNDLNHMFAYIQLPLKLSEGNANGELYVYTNKKSMAKRGGDISALLHLDMDHIGMLDVYIVLQNNDKVSTNFRVQDEETLELLAKHIDELDKKLEEKGYKMSSSIQISEVDQPVMKEILQENKNNIPVAMYTFDARA